MSSDSISPSPSTFSIVAADPEHQEWGVAVQSKFLGVGSVVPWAKAQVGAVATQARANTTYGPLGLQLMGSGKSAREAIEILVGADEQQSVRQLAMVDSLGTAWAYTGSQCIEWAGHRIGPNFSCQGNILAGPQVVEAMAEAFLAARGDLAERMLQALAAGQKAGGDRRGQQSAAILVVRDNAGYGSFNDRYIDLRVEDHPDPIAELIRLVDIHRVYFVGAHAGKMYPFRGPIIQKVSQLMLELGRLNQPANAEEVYKAFALFTEENGLTMPEPGWVNHDAIMVAVRMAERR